MRKAVNDMDSEGSQRRMAAWRFGSASTQAWRAMVPESACVSAKCQRIRGTGSGRAAPGSEDGSGLSRHLSAPSNSSAAIRVLHPYRGADCNARERGISRPQSLYGNDP